MIDESITCWSVIRGAAEGRTEDRGHFAARYEPVIRGGLAGRWKGTPLIRDLDDAVQDVFLEAFRPGGALDRVDPDRGSGFRAFLFGVVRNVARRHEQGRGKRALNLESWVDIPDRDGEFVRQFDQAWASSLLRQAADLQSARAGDERARRRVELLALRFSEGLPIREIASRWDEDAARLHHEYARARREFREALIDVVLEHQPGDRGAAERESHRLAGLFE